jgi:hypothetical protein
MQIENKCANSVCNIYRSQNLVCPPIHEQGLFTVAAADNIDHNLSSTTAQSALHGTAISLMQFAHRPFQNASPSCYSEAASSSASDIVLPQSYTEVLPCIMPSTVPPLPHLNISLSDTAYVAHLEYDWLKKVDESIDVSIEHSGAVSWAAFRSEVTDNEPNPIAIMSLLPLFRHNANSAAMIRHCLSTVQLAIAKLNPGQTPVVTFDQPLFALAKQIQWHWPNLYGEDKLVIMMGGLHIEMAALRMLGHFLEGSGWCESLTQATIATAGVAESFFTCITC